MESPTPHTTPASRGLHRDVPAPTPADARGRAFSLIELVIVVVILGVIAAIAVPRFSSASSHAMDSSLNNSLVRLQEAADRFTVEHLLNHAAGTESGGLVDGGTLAQRLTERTTEDAGIAANGTYGPYIRRIPANPSNGLATVRVDGAAAGAGTAGWRYDTTLGVFQPDHTGVFAVGDGTFTAKPVPSAEFGGDAVSLGQGTSATLPKTGGK